MKPQPGLSKQISRESLGDVPVIHVVPDVVVMVLSDLLFIGCRNSLDSFSTTGNCQQRFRYGEEAAGGYQ